MKGTYSAEGQTWPVVIIAEHKDGTVDLAREDDPETLVIGKCPVSKEAKDGHVVVVAGEEEETPRRRSSAKPTRNTKDASKSEGESSAPQAAE